MNRFRYIVTKTDPYAPPEYDEEMGAFFDPDIAADLADFLESQVSDTSDDCYIIEVVRLRKKV